MKLGFLTDEDVTNFLSRQYGVPSTILKLRTPDYKSLLLIGADTFSCDWTNRAISVNYKPGGVADGDLMSVEVR